TAAPDTHRPEVPGPPPGEQPAGELVVGEVGAGDAAAGGAVVAGEDGDVQDAAHPDPVVDPGQRQGEALGGHVLQALAGPHAGEGATAEGQGLEVARDP